jgi:uncharacterized protein YndB with AHSA1/START domain
MGKLTEQGLDWLASAPARIVNEAVVKGTPDEVFAVITDHASWPTWFRSMRKAEPGSVAEGVGGTRTVWVGPAKVLERFIAWEPGTRFSFTVVESSAPGLKSIVEDLALEPSGPAHTKVTYTVGIEPAGPAALAKVVQRAAKPAFASGLKGLTKHLAAR